MEIEEVCDLVWTFLAETGEYFSAQEIIKNQALESSLVRKSLGQMSAAGLLKRNRAENGFNGYMFKQNLNPLQWAQAVELGISLSSLENYARLIQGHSQEDVLELAARGEVERHREVEKKRKHKKLCQYLEGRRASQAAETDLAKLVEDVRAANLFLNDSSKSSSLEKTNQMSNYEDMGFAVSVALKEAQEEAERALLALQKNLK